MPAKNKPTTATQMHQAFWMLKQLHHGRSNPENYINFRAIYNAPPFKNSDGKLEHPSEVVFNTFVKIRDLTRVWQESLLNTLNWHNFHSTKPANIYYSINPLVEPAHKKSAYAGFCAFYLDLDDSKSYTRDTRWSQIFFWGELGFKPSFVLSSGHGWHVYWVLNKIISREEGEPILKRMVAASGCKEGGNCWDVARVFRLAQYYNNKHFSTGDRPACALVLPDPITTDLITTNAMQYSPERFLDFPPSELTDLQRYYNEARRLSADNPALFETKVQEVLAGALQAQRAQETQTATTAGTAIAVQNQTNAAAKSTQTGYTPRFTVVPAAADIKWGRGENWMRKYCKLGHSGLTQGELDALIQKNGWKDSSASALDFMVMYSLVRHEYTKDAIREFWVRNDNRLYRADKEEKNPNYFDMSYENALKYAQAARDQNTATSNNGADHNRIFVEQNQTFITTKEGAEAIITAALKLNEIFIDEDAATPSQRELYDFDVTYVDPSAPEGVRTQNMIIPHNAFGDIKEFRKYCCDLFCCVTGSTSHLQHLIKHLRLTFRAAKSRAFHSKLVFKDDKFIFPCYTITKDAILQHDTSAVSAHVEKRIPMLKYFAAKFKPIEETVTQLKTHWLDTLQVHLPRTVASLLGFIAANAIAPVFRDQLAAQFHVPTVNIRGPSNSAKSDVVKYLCTFTGIQYGKNIHGIKSSDFAITELLSATNFLPIGLDEFKEEIDNARNLAAVRQLFRRMYSGEAIVKGRRDMSIATTELHGGLIVIGELALERIGDLSEVSRLIPINSDGFNIDSQVNHERWHRLSDVYWYELGPLFFKWILNQDIAQCYTAFKALREETEEIIQHSFAGEKHRIANNLAAIWSGCRLVDSFIKTLWNDAPTIENVCRPRETLVQYMCGWAQEVGQTVKTVTLVPQPHTDLSQPAPAPKEEIKVFANTELLSVIRTYGSMIEHRDKLIRDQETADVICYHENEAKELLYVPFATMYNLVFQFNRSQGKLMPSEGKLKSLIRHAHENGDIWVVDGNRVVTVRNTNFRAVIMNVRMLRSFGVWPTKIVLNQATPGIAQKSAEENTIIK